jgi:hypothetical protein
VPQLIVGFIIGVILVYVRLLFPEFIIHPVGVIYAFMGHDSTFMFFPFLIMWIIKLIVLRFGGVDIYERYLVPFVLGFSMIGYIFTVVNNFEYLVIRCIWIPPSV